MKEMVIFSFFLYDKKTDAEIDSDGCWRSEYKVNAEVAKAILPILEKEGNMYFPYD